MKKVLFALCILLAACTATHTNTSQWHLKTEANAIAMKMFNDMRTGDKHYSEPKWSAVDATITTFTITDSTRDKDMLTQDRNLRNLWRKWWSYTAGKDTLTMGNINSIQVTIRRAFEPVIYQEAVLK